MQLMLYGGTKNTFVFPSFIGGVPFMEAVKRRSKIWGLGVKRRIIKRRSGCRGCSNHLFLSPFSLYPILLHNANLCQDSHWKDHHIGSRII